MSGSSYDSECPRCGGTMQCYSDWKPHDVSSGLCLDCGYAYDTEIRQASIDEVNEYRVESYEMEPIAEFREPHDEWCKYGFGCTLGGEA